MGGCATALAAWASGPSALASRGPWGRRRRGTSGPARSRVQLWERRSVHRSAEMTPRSRFGAFVYTVGLWAWVVSGLGIAIVYTNGRIGPLRAVSGRLCTLLTVAPLRTGAGTQECTQIGGDDPSEPFRGVCVHCCAVGLGCEWPWDRNSVHKWEDRASPCRFGAFVYTVATRALRRELRRVARAPQPPWRAGGTPSRWAPLPWSGRQTLREWRRREVGVFAEASTHTNPRGANSWASFPTIVLS